MDEVMSEAYKWLRLKEEEILTTVLQQHLGRVPTKEDALLCGKVYREGIHRYDRYSFFYKGTFLGEVKYMYDLPATLRIEFSPAQKDHFIIKYNIENL